MTLTIYDARSQKQLGTFTVPSEFRPAGGGFKAFLSADGTYVEWAFTRAPCMATEIATGKLDRDAEKRKICSGWHD